jgi:hypothetical protein
VSDTWDAFPEAPPTARPGAVTTIPDPSGGPTRVIMHMNDSWDAFPERSAVDSAIGMGKQAGIGVAKGAIGLAGMPGDITDLLTKGTQAAGNFVADKLGLDRAPEPGPSGVQNSADIQKQVEQVTGPFRQPQNQNEADAQTIGEFLPAAMAGPGGFARKVITQDLIPAATTITAGRFSDQNPYVKALAGFLGGAGAAVAFKPGQAAETLRKQLPEFVTDAHITRAGNLIEAARNRGISLTWPEALSKVTGQPVLTDLQRVVESHPKSRTQMQTFMSDRPAQVEGAARQQFDQVGSQHPNPSMIGPEASKTATGVLDNVRGRINQASDPYYKQAESVLLTPAEMSHVKAIPGWTEARDAVRDNPQINWRVAHLPDHSVGFLNEVKKHFDQAAENAASKFNPAKNHQVQASNEMAASALKQIGIAKSADYEIALEIQKQARQQYLEPLMRGPLGQLARKDPTTKRAIAALFPTNPVPGTEGEVRNAVFAIGQKRPEVARQLVRAYAEMVFNEAAKNLQGGANQFSGAKFAVRIAGNPQQRENLKAAMEALPHANTQTIQSATGTTTIGIGPSGKDAWKGFENLLDILEATGTRQPKGSLTSFNSQELKAMEGGGTAGLAATAASPGKWWTFANDKYKSWSLGHNLDQLARIITNPNAGRALMTISRIPVGTARAEALAGRMILQLGATTTEPRSKAN